MWFGVKGAKKETNILRTLPHGLELKLHAISTFYGQGLRVEFRASSTREVLKAIYGPPVGYLQSWKLMCEPQKYSFANLG